MVLQLQCLLQMKKFSYSLCNIKTLGEHLCQWGKVEDNSVLFSSTPLSACFLFLAPLPPPLPVPQMPGFFGLLLHLPHCPTPRVLIRSCGFNTTAIILLHFSLRAPYSSKFIFLTTYWALLPQSPLNTNT